MTEATAEAIERVIKECGRPTIGEYGAIGNCKTVALIADNGSLDWMCAPHFSAPSLFAALLDADRGGRFVVRASGGRCRTRRYLTDTNVLCTEHDADGGQLRLIDYMVMANGADLRAEHQILRHVQCLEGEVDVDVLFQPRPDYARASPSIRVLGELGWQFQHQALVGYLQMSPMPTFRAQGDSVYASCHLRAGQSFVVSLSLDHAEPAMLASLAQADEDLDRTSRWWRDYSRRCSYHGRYRPQVLRSHLALKLLDSAVTGAMIAAATTSLPESYDGDRNWDYRYCWLRDSGQVLQSLTDIGYGDESLAFLEWMLHATHVTQPRLQPVYDIFGETRLPEYELDHLAGYHGHGPVRIGNSAREQLQLDVYGEVILAARDLCASGFELEPHDLRLLTGFADKVIHCWQEPDHGIWEIREPKRHYTHSKVMCWAALDGLLKLDARHNLGIDRDAIHEQCERIRAEIDQRAFDPSRGCYLAHYDSDVADATLLLLPRLGFLDTDDPRVEATRRFVEEQLDRDGKVYRYPPGGAYDGMAGTEHPFGICSFWMVECLARQGRHDEAIERFDALLELANDLGLYAEQFHVDTGAPVGNFPQAFTHVGLITAALELPHGDDDVGLPNGART